MQQAFTFSHSNNATGLHVASIHCAVLGAGTMSDPVAYTQRGLLSYFLPGEAPHDTSRPVSTASAAPSTSSHQPAGFYTRAFEEGARLLEDERVTKRARLEQINANINSSMMEREDVKENLQEIGRKQFLASDILDSWLLFFFCVSFNL